MLCSGCGKDIPFNGSICPHCQRDKSGDQTFHVFAIVGMLIGGAIGYAIGGILWALGGGFLGVLLMAIFAMPKTPPAPEVRITNRETQAVKPTSLSPKPEISTPEKRLRDLDNLRKEGLISEQEFEAKRTEVLSQF